MSITSKQFKAGERYAIRFWSHPGSEGKVKDIVTEDEAYAGAQLGDTVVIIKVETVGEMVLRLAPVKTEEVCDD